MSKTEWISPIEALEAPLTAHEVMNAMKNGAFTNVELRRIAMVLADSQKRQIREQFPLGSWVKIVHAGQWGGMTGQVVKVNVTTVLVKTSRGEVKCSQSLLVKA